MTCLILTLNFFFTSSLMTGVRAFLSCPNTTVAPIPAAVVTTATAASSSDHTWIGNGNLDPRDINSGLSRNVNNRLGHRRGKIPSVCFFCFCLSPSPLWSTWRSWFCDDGFGRDVEDGIFISYSGRSIIGTLSSL